MAEPDQQRHGVTLTNLDAELFGGAGATKRDLVDYLDAVADRILPVLADRALSVIRVHRGQEAFMQKNVPKYTPDWIPTVTQWAGTSKRQVRYAVADRVETLIWFANQRAVEYHPALIRNDGQLTHLVLDLDPPEGSEAFAQAAAAALLVRDALTQAGLQGAVKTSGAKGVHVFVPIQPTSIEDAAAATRAIAARAAALDPAIATTAFVKDDRDGKVFVDATRVGGATVICAYSPRLRPGVPVSCPVSWDDLVTTDPRAHTIHTVTGLTGDPWAAQMPDPQLVPDDLVAQGHTIDGGRVQAMHEGKRRAARSRNEQAD